jgi:hypothetical protein
MKTKILLGMIIGTFLGTLGLISADAVWSAEPMYEALNPRGLLPPIKITPLAPRIPDLNNKVVYVVNNSKLYAEPFFEAIADLLRQRFPRAEVKHVLKQEAYMLEEPKLWEEVKQRANAVIMGTKD